MVLLDAYALVALLRNEPAANEVELLLQKGGTGISALNLAEALDILLRRRAVSEGLLRRVIEPMLATRLGVVSVDAARAWRAAELRARHYQRRTSSLSMADCVLLATASSEDEIATADPALLKAARAEGLTALALPDSSGRRH